MLSRRQDTNQTGCNWLARVAPLIAGTGAGLAYIDERLFWLAWFSLVPLGIAWTRLSGQLPLVSAFLGGLIYNGLALAWLYRCGAEPVDWIGPNTVAWLAISLIAATFFAGMCRYGQWLVVRARLPVALALPVAWVTWEFAKQFMGVVLSEAGFPWTKLGLTQVAWLQLAQAADLGGEPLLSFLVCMVNGALVDATTLLRGGSQTVVRRAAYGAALGFALFAAAVAYGQWRMGQNPGQPGPVVCLMGELDLPPAIDQRRIVRAVQDTRLDADGEPSPHPDLLLWPELAWHHKLLTPSSGSTISRLCDLPRDVRRVMVAAGQRTYRRFVEKSLLDAAAAANAVVVIGCERLEPSVAGWSRFNSVVCANAQAKSIDWYDKRWLVPWREFVPHWIGLPNAPEQYEPGLDERVFRVSHRSRTYRFRPSICYDLCFSRHFQLPGADSSAGGRQVDFFVHSGSEGQDAGGITARVLIHTAQLRAIESRRAIVRNVSFGCSGIVDSNGILQTVVGRQLIDEPIVLPPVPIDQRWSPYARAGDWPLMLLSVAIAVVAWRRQHAGTTNTVESDPASSSAQGE